MSDHPALDREEALLFAECNVGNMGVCTGAFGRLIACVLNKLRYAVHAAGPFRTLLW
jgi:hypothetical protein